MAIMNGKKKYFIGVRSRNRQRDDSNISVGRFIVGKIIL
jgi:hypothetical protein